MVAIKVMHFPVQGLMDVQPRRAVAALGQAEPVTCMALRPGTRPHMAVMEAVVSSTLGHPNVVQVGG